MRFLGVGETCDLAALYLRLKQEGHEVRVAVSDPLAQGTLAGLVEKTADWRAEIQWIRSAPDQGVILFESVSEGFGALQDQLRADGLQVVGGSAYGDRLENDRAFGQAALAEIGLPLSPSWAFDDPGAAASFVQAHPGAYVVKASGADHAASDTFVGVLPDGRDVLSDLRRRRLRRPNQALILTSVIRGVEMGVGAYFNGRRFLRPACLDWEHKRFFPGDLGELTGEMGTVASFDRTAPFFERTLAKMEGALARHGHVGYVNLNTMVNEDGIWPLEFTCRFGYPGYAVLDPLQATPWGRLTQAMARGEDLALETLAGFCVGMVLTTPPFPYSRQEIDESVGHPVCFAPGADMRHHHFGEVGLDADGRLATSGLYGWTLVVTGVGDSLPEARRHALRNIKQVYVPNGRWRTDIGRRLIKADLARLERLGVFEP